MVLELAIPSNIYDGVSLQIYQVSDPNPESN